MVTTLTSPLAPQPGCHNDNPDVVAPDEWLKSWHHGNSRIRKTCGVISDDKFGIMVHIRVGKICGTSDENIGIVTAIGFQFQT